MKIFETCCFLSNLAETAKILLLVRQRLRLLVSSVLWHHGGSWDVELPRSPGKDVNAQTQLSNVSLCNRGKYLVDGASGTGDPGAGDA